MEHPRRRKICGTSEGSHIWCNSTDNTGILFAGIVWANILFAAAVCIIVLINGEMIYYNGIVILVLVFLALWAHLKTMLGDPGAVPSNAYPVQGIDSDRSSMNIAMCGRCDGFKPPGSHHDRISNRCISRMDHFCPWMNNAIGAKNQKNFLLFLIYTDIVSAYMYVVVAWHMIDCTESDTSCVPYSGIPLQLARVLIFILLFAVLFTSSMIINQVYGLVIGHGTIDRMKITRDDPEKNVSIPFSHVFGSSYITYILPLDPVFVDEEEVFKYRIGEEKYQSTL